MQESKKGKMSLFQILDIKVQIYPGSDVLVEWKAALDLNFLHFYLGKSISQLLWSWDGLAHWLGNFNPNTSFAELRGLPRPSDFSLGPCAHPCPLLWLRGLIQSRASRYIALAGAPWKWLWGCHLWQMHKNKQEKNVTNAGTWLLSPFLVQIFQSTILWCHLG